MRSKNSGIFANILPIIIMIGLVPLVSNDYLLSFIYAVFIGFLFMMRYEKKEGALLMFGVIFMFLSEWVFLSTGVETFNRTSLFNIMPLWLPILWGYGFVVIKRVVRILEK